MKDGVLNPIFWGIKPSERVQKEAMDPIYSNFTRNSLLNSGAEHHAEGIAPIPMHIEGGQDQASMTETALAAIHTQDESQPTEAAPKAAAPKRRVKLPPRKHAAPVDSHIVDGQNVETSTQENQELPPLDLDDLNNLLDNLIISDALGSNNPFQLKKEK
ncbi:MAG: hypothetical protein KDK63_00185 [Chlamydiia bacterium]|nr:hypothetical protein [Chlamydiia bacterium]